MYRALMVFLARDVDTCRGSGPTTLHDRRTPGRKRAVSAHARAASRGVQRLLGATAPEWPDDGTRRRPRNCEVARTHRALLHHQKPGKRFRTNGPWLASIDTSSPDSLMRRGSAHLRNWRRERARERSLIKSSTPPSTRSSSAIGAYRDRAARATALLAAAQSARRQPQELVETTKPLCRHGSQW